MSFLKFSVITLACMSQFTFSQIMDIRDNVFPDIRTERTVFKSTHRFSRRTFFTSTHSWMLGNYCLVDWMKKIGLGDGLSLIFKFI